MRDNKMSRETWKSPAEFSNYEVSTLGRVRSSKRNWVNGKKILKPADNGNGYLFYKLTDNNGEVRKVYAQELVLSTFVSARPEGLQAAHINGDRANNTLGNLRWATPKSNANDKLWHGTGSKVNDGQALIINQMFKNGGKARELAEMFGVSTTTVRKYGKAPVQASWIVQDALARGLNPQAVKKTV